MTAFAVLGQLAAERSIEQITEDYPYLEQADIMTDLFVAQRLS